ncbi:DUF1168 domain protein [Rutstroemia sp. NJR-2017a WRK4]|nr:DUF1168 domain protein [Rutstroemia sp. NJR-2017a WRK4]
MSENIPESVPTSADPRSKRPLKRRALSPRSETASHIEKLMAAPDKNIQIPTSGSLVKKNDAAHVPEIVQNVQGSSAGAGSGEFHVYKASRRREYERLKSMDEEVKAEKEAEEWERNKRKKEEEDAERTRKNREKRMKKMQKKKGGNAGAGNGANGAQAGGIKARVVGDAKNENESNENGEKGTAGAQEEIGVVIHDDDD